MVARLATAIAKDHYVVPMFSSLFLDRFSHVVQLSNIMEIFPYGGLLPSVVQVLHTLYNK